MIGAYVQPVDARETVESIRQAEAAGVPAVWLTMGGTTVDAAVIFGAAAMQTQRIKLGTSIIPTWPKHPVALAQQAAALASLMPGRFRLGIGPSHQAAMETNFGVEWRTPLHNLREYLMVLTTLLRTGEVDYAGRFVRTRAKLLGPVDVPVLASALRPASFHACGELADGAISWVCPWSYLRNTALPALREGAASAGRPTPALIAHVPVCLSTNRETVREAAREQIGRYSTIPFYQAMFATAGYGDVSKGYPDRLVDDLVVSGDGGSINERLRSIIAEGASEVIAHPIHVEEDRAASMARFFDAVAKANAAAGFSA